MSSYIDEVRQRLANGESFTDISWGKGWQERLPHLARLTGFAGISSSSTDGNKNRGFGAFIHAGSGFQTICTEILSFEVNNATKQEALSQFDDVCRQWLDNNGESRAQEMKSGWTNNPKWQTDFSYLALWIANGRRYCVEIKLFLDGSAKIKAWFYDKPANRELVLVEEALKATQEEALVLLNLRISEWLQTNEMPQVSTEDTSAFLPL